MVQKEVTNIKVASSNYNNDRPRSILVTKCRKVYPTPLHLYFHPYEL